MKVRRDPEQPTMLLIETDGREISLLQQAAIERVVEMVPDFDRAVPFENMLLELDVRTPEQTYQLTVDEIFARNLMRLMHDYAVHTPDKAQELRTMAGDTLVHVREGIERCDAGEQALVFHAEIEREVIALGTEQLFGALHKHLTAIATEGTRLVTETEDILAWEAEISEG